jgi:hypothetical protein
MCISPVLVSIGLYDFFRYCVEPQQALWALALDAPAQPAAFDRFIQILPTSAPKCFWFQIQKTKFMAAWTVF